jgi:hypothetical protein
VGGRNPRSLTLDAGALIAVDRRDRRVNILIERAIERGGQIIVPAGALAQVRRSNLQVPLTLLLADPSVKVEVIDADLAQAAGILCGRRGTEDVIDATVALTGRRYDSIVLTSDVDDLRRLDPKLEIVAVST